MATSQQDPTWQNVCHQQLVAGWCFVLSGQRKKSYLNLCNRKPKSLNLLVCVKVIDSTIDCILKCFEFLIHF